MVLIQLVCLLVAGSLTYKKKEKTILVPLFVSWACTLMMSAPLIQYNVSVLGCRKLISSLIRLSASIKQQETFTAKLEWVHKILIFKT